MDEHPEADEVLAVVRIDGRRCELHQQCEGLSDALFEAPEQQIVVRKGDGDVPYMERLVRSCPMGALALDMTVFEETPEKAPQNSR